MIIVSVPLELILDTSFIFFVFIIYQELTFQNSLVNIAKSFVYSIIWGFVGLLFEDYSYVLFLMFFVCKITVNKRSIKEAKTKVIPLIVSLVLEMILSLLSSLIIRIFWLRKLKIFPFLNANDSGALLSLLIEIAFFIVILVVIKNRGGEVNDIVRKIESLNLENRTFWMLISIFVSFEVILFVGNMEGITAKINGTILILFISFLIFMCWQTFNLIQMFSTRQKIKNDVEQNKQMNDYLINIQEQYDDLRRFKHDFKNIILSMNTDSRKDISDDYENLYQELVHKNEFTHDLSGRDVLEFNKIENESLRVMVIQKFFKAKYDGIKMNIEMMDGSIKILSSLLNVVRIVRILLDNAIEETSSGKDKSLRIAFIKNIDSIEISVENPVNHPINIREIFKEGYSTKGKNREIDLSNVSTIIDKDRNLFLDTEIKDNLLRITLIVMSPTKTTN